MSAEFLNRLIDSLVEQILAKLGPRLIEWLDERRSKPEADPLLSTPEVAKRLGLSETTVRHLVACGELKKAPGITEIRIRQSVVDAYGTSNPTNKRTK